MCCAVFGHDDWQSGEGKPRLLTHPAACSCRSGIHNEKKEVSSEEASERILDRRIGYANPRILCPEGGGVDKSIPGRDSMNDMCEEALWTSSPVGWRLLAFISIVSIIIIINYRRFAGSAEALEQRDNA